MKKTTLMTSTGAALLLATCAQAASIAIANHDFELPVTDPNANSQLVQHWTEENAAQEYVANSAGFWAPAGASQAGYFTSSATGINQDLSHNWTTADVFTLSIDAYDVGWRSGATGDAIGVQLREANGTILWDSGSISLDGTVQGSKINQITWITDSSAATNTFVFNASSFTTGTPGEQVNLRIYKGSGPAYFDNVSLNVVPEPTSAALLGLGGLALILRRRK